MCLPFEEGLSQWANLPQHCDEVPLYSGHVTTYPTWCVVDRFREWEWFWHCGHRLELFGFDLHGTVATAHLLHSLRPQKVSHRIELVFFCVCVCFIIIIVAAAVLDKDAGFKMLIQI